MASGQRIGKAVAAIGIERQRHGPYHSARIEITVQMRKQRAAARGLPFECAAEFILIDGNQQQVMLSGDLAAVSATCPAVEKWMKPSRRS
jgi:hypothetical protein